MVNYLLDTNVVSEPSKPRPDPKVMAWIAATPIRTRYVSVLTLGELTKGLAIAVKRSRERAEIYQQWLIAVRAQYEGRILPVNALVAETWGMLASTGSYPVVDALILSTARAHGLVLATRNRRDVEGLGVKIFNPWTD